MTDVLLWTAGSQKCLYANRVSFVFDFKGPSMIIDTACSSSLVAFNTAVNDLRLGENQLFLEKKNYENCFNFIYLIHYINEVQNKQSFRYLIC